MTQIYADWYGEDTNQTKKCTSLYQHPETSPKVPGVAF